MSVCPTTSLPFGFFVYNFVYIVAFPMRTKCHPFFIIFLLMTLMTYGTEHKLRVLSSCNFVQPLVTVTLSLCVW